MAQCSSLLGRTQTPGQVLTPTSRYVRATRPARRALRVHAAVTSSESDFDIKALLRDALEAVDAPSASENAAPTPSAPSASALTDTPSPPGPVPDLPGTEILPSAVPTPAPPPTPTPVPAIPEMAPSIASPALPEVPAPTKIQGFDPEAWKAAQTAGKSAASATASKTSAAAPQASDAASQAADKVSGAVSDATAALSGGASALGESVSGAASAMSDSVGGAAAALGGSLSQAAGAAGSAAAAATGAVSGLTQKLSSVVDEQLGVVKGNLDSAGTAVQSSLGAVQQSVGGTVSAAVDQLPPPVKDALAATSSTAAEASQLAAANPQAAAVVAGASVLIPTALLWRALYGGYSGQLTPQQASDMLQTEDALLVDIRSEAQRLERGVAELRRGALGKGAAVPPVQLAPSLARRVRSADALALDIVAASIAGLGKVGSGTRIIVMDNQGERSKAVARAAAAAGLRAYVLQGGFKAWQAAGLRVRENATEYEASVADAVEDQVETLTEVATSQLEKLKNPVTAATALGAVAALGYAALNFHAVLQFLGVLGLEWSAYRKLSEYDSPEEALEDLSRWGERVGGVLSNPQSLLTASKAAAAQKLPAASSQQRGNGGEGGQNMA